jgi:hypothetical protein
MATLKDRHKCCVCGNLATSALEFQDENGICNSVIWFCDKDIRGSTKKRIKLGKTELAD